VSTGLSAVRQGKTSVIIREHGYYLCMVHSGADASRLLRRLGASEAELEALRAQYVDWSRLHPMPPGVIG